MNVLAQLSLNESAELDFGIEVSGADEKTMDIRFIIEGPEYGIVCRCVESGGVITASVPKLSGILPSGTYSAKLEVVVDGKHFQPLTENIQFNPPVTIGVSSQVTVKPENNIRVQTRDVKIRVAEDTVTVKPLNREAIKGSSLKDYLNPVVETVDTEDKNQKLQEMHKKIKEYENKIRQIKK